MTEKQDRRDEAKADYASGMKYKEIAAKYGVSISTVKSWKSRYWSGDKVATSQKKVATKKEKVATSKAFVESDAPEKRKLFALLYLQSFNAIRAYMTAYGASYKTAHANAYRLMANDGMQKLIDELKAEYFSRVDMTTQAAIAEYAKIAMADLGDYLEFGAEDIPLWTKVGTPAIDPKTKEQKTYRQSYVHLKPQDQVDTSLIKSVRVGRDGPILELYDKDKALDAIMKSVSNLENQNGGQITKINFIRTNRSVQQDGNDGESG